VDGCLEILTNRVDQFGVSEPVISKSGSRRIVAELAGLSAEEARKIIGATALLEFKLVGEVVDFKPVLDRIDNHMKRQAGIVVDSAETPDSIKAVTDLFGQVVEKKPEAPPKSDTVMTTEDSSEVQIADSTGTTDADTAQVKSETDSAEPELPSETAEEFRSRPFGSMLVGLPWGGVGIRLQDILTGEEIEGTEGMSLMIWGRERTSITSFDIELMPHSFRVLKVLN